MTSFFRFEEFACPCCGKSWVKPEFISRLNEAREMAGVPFSISTGGGCRCQAYNTKAGHSSTSSHLIGEAADIRARYSAHRYKIITALIAAGFSRIGIADMFIHVDGDHNKPQNVIWTY